MRGERVKKRKKDEMAQHFFSSSPISSHPIQKTYGGLTKSFFHCHTNHHAWRISGSGILSFLDIRGFKTAAEVYDR